MSLTDLRPGDLAELPSGGPLLRLVGRNGVPIVLQGVTWPRRTLWLCRWWQAAGQAEAWVAAEGLQLVKRL